MNCLLKGLRDFTLKSRSLPTLNKGGCPRRDKGDFLGREKTKEHIDFSRKLAVSALALIILLCIAPLTNAGFVPKAMADGDNLLMNGDFEMSDNGMPLNWDTNSWDNSEGYTVFSVDPSGGKTGNGAACIENAELNDSRFTQKVTVKPGQLYRLSGDVKVQGADGTWGATLSFQDTFTHTVALMDTTDQWQHVEVYARAGAGQTSATVFVRLGGYGSTCHGKAWFDNVSLQQVDALPSGAVESSMATNKPSSSGSNNPNADNQYLPYIVLVALAFGAFMLWAFRRTDHGEGVFEGRRNVGLYIAGALVTGLAYSVIQFIVSKFSDSILANDALKGIESVQFEMRTLVICLLLLGIIPALAFMMIRTGIKKERRRYVDLLYIGYVAFALRCIISVSIRGYENDIDCWLGWSGQAAGGLFGMYSTGGFNDYPPGYMYVLWFVGKLNALGALLPSAAGGAFVSYGARFQLLMVKMPSILADIGTAWFIYRLASRRLSQRASVLLGVLYIFNPLVLLDSAAWGQIDSILALIALACFWQVYRGKMGWAAVLYGVGLLVKPQMLLFAPVMLAALVNACRNAGSFAKGLKVCLITLGAGLGTVLLLAAPFWIVQISTALQTGSGDAVRQAVLWLPNQYLNSLGTYKNASINACNLLALFGGNWAPDSQAMFGIPYFVWGYAGMAAVSIFVFCMSVLRDRDNRRILLWAAVMIAGVFVLGLRMHERYMFPALALLLVYYIVERDRRALYLFGTFTITQFLNAGIVLANQHMSTDVLQLGPFSIASPTGISLWVFLISLAAVAAFIYMVYASAKAETPLLYGGPGPEEEADLKKERILEDLAVKPEASRILMKKKDWLLMGGLTLIYAIIALVYLGDLHVPQTAWPGLRTGDYAVIDLGQSCNVAQIEHYDSLTTGNLTVSSSDDGENWTDQIDLKHKAVAAGDNDDLGIYNWTTNTVDFEARYIKVTVTTPAVRMLEMVFKDASGNVIHPSGITDAEEVDKTDAAGDDTAAQQKAHDEAIADAQNLIDEQSLVPAVPGFMNSMYFDEIYHARTGWEFTQGNLTPYENTHPPLGKDLIALGILIFGMDPFGWRVMGTLMGILMVPAMYLFGMAVFKRTRYAFIAAFLFTFDFMHFVQTRIATIDSYSVFFIILTFLCMYLYMHKNFNTQKLKHTWWPLALSGIFFGLASASKWIGLYAGAGLAVMLFYTLYRRCREYLAVKRGEVEVDDETRAKVLSGFYGKMAGTLGWCLLFFIVIPAIIYFASYIPFDAGSAGGKGTILENLKYAWQNQASMYHYHSTLVDNHPFKSPWYEWPFLIKPMWFYKAPSLPPGYMGSIATFGNPAVWWPGTAALIWLGWRLFTSRKFRLPEAFMLAGMLTEFLPWVLVSRTMFIYHYFASVPFFVIAIVLYIREWEERRDEPVDKNWQLTIILLLAAFTILACFMSPLLVALLAVPLAILLIMYWRRDRLELYRRDMTHLYMAIVLALFVLFYPVLSGLPIPSWYGHMLKWMPGWWFTY